jgi:phosphatidyl-myo-inositol dimannoside synthase
MSALPMPDRKLLLATPDFPPSTGGIAVLLERLVGNLPGFETRVLAFGEDGAAAYDGRAAFEVRRVSSVDARRPLSVPVLNAALVAEARRFRPDAILSGHVVAGIAAVPLRRLAGIPFVQYLHADEFRVRGRLTASVSRRADAAIAVSRYTERMALDAGVESSRLRMIHPGVDLPASTGGERDERPTLLTVASFLSERKGHDVIVRALPRIREAVPDVRWIAIGDGPRRAGIEASAAAAGLGDVARFLGRVGDEERDRWLDRAHVFCMPSRVPPDGLGGEGFGIVYLEAGAHGLPVIGGNVAGALDSVLDGETGLLVDPEDPDAVADAAIELLSDRARARLLGAAGRRHAEAHAWPRIGHQVEAVLHEVCE